MRVFILDSTLRDGAASVRFSIADKLAVASRLDEFGVDYIDGGWPAVDPRDREFFAAARNLDFRHSRLVAYGAVRAPRTSAENDFGVNVVFQAGTDVVCLAGETWDRNVYRDLNTTEAEHLVAIADTIRFFADRGREVLFNADNFFDGYDANPEFAMRALAAARDAGAAVLCLCDTDGGALPSRVARICRAVKERFAPSGMESVMLGIHAHNDGGVAVANTIAAVEQGIAHVQGCFNGYGERCGCADLSSIIPDLELKAGCITVGRERLEELTVLARFIAETANLPLPSHRPFVGADAHAGPQVGNADETLLARVGHAALPDEARREALDMVRLKEEEGYDFTAADGSFELIVREALDPSARPFTVLKYEVCTRHAADGTRSSAEVTLECGEAVLNAAADGNGPVNALDRALRKALSTVYDSVDRVRLVDYKVRVLESDHGTDARCRVLIHWTDGARHWNTAGVSDNVVEASWLALVDAVSLEVLRAKKDEALATSSVRDYSWAV